MTATASEFKDVELEAAIRDLAGAKRSADAHTAGTQGRMHMLEEHLDEKCKKCNLNQFQELSDSRSALETNGRWMRAGERTRTGTFVEEAGMRDASDGKLQALQQQLRNVTNEQEQTLERKTELLNLDRKRIERQARERNEDQDARCRLDAEPRIMDKQARMCREKLDGAAEGAAAREAQACEAKKRVRDQTRKIGRLEADQTHRMADLRVKHEQANKVYVNESALRRRLQEARGQHIIRVEPTQIPLPTLETSPIHLMLCTCPSGA